MADTAKTGLAKTSSGSPSRGARLELYDAVVSKAELLAVRTQKVLFDVKDEYYRDFEKNRFGYGIEGGEVRFDDKTGLASALVSAEVTVKSGRKKVLVLRVEYDLAYRNLEGCDEAAVRAFVKRVGTFTCWPYFRSLVANLDWSSGTMLPMLPVLREKVLPAKVTSES